jgi:hypothetical protein
MARRQTRQRLMMSSISFLPVISLSLRRILHLLRPVDELSAGTSLLKGRTADLFLALSAWPSLKIRTACSDYLDITITQAIFYSR